ncbi:MAG TPA: hypothetical protein VGL81_07295 [Polyangiaceae bacterium]
MPTLNRTTLRDRCRNAIAGVKKDLASVTTITLNGVDYTAATLTTLLQSFIDLADAAVTARASWLIAVQKEAVMLTQILGVLSALKAYVTLKFGPGAVDTQADFGFSPKKAVTRTVEEKAASAAKARATRAARHTMGSDQEKAVTGASVAQPVTPATPTTNPTPAVTPQAPVTPKS